MLQAKIIGEVVNGYAESLKECELFDKNGK